MGASCAAELVRRSTGSDTTLVVSLSNHAGSPGSAVNVVTSAAAVDVAPRP